MVKFLDLHCINKPYLNEFSSELDAIIENGRLILGENVRLFEDEFAKYCGVSHCIGVASGLDAIRLIFEGLILQGKIQKGQEVIVAANTYFATILGIMQAGLKPVLVEPELKTLNINPALVESAVVEKTGAIMAVHLYGRLCNMDELNRIASKHDLILIDDCAHAHGASDQDGNKVGGLTDASAFSFYPTKGLGALGDGGAITTNDSSLATILRAYRNYGTTEKDLLRYSGVNSRLDEIQAAFLRLKLRDLDSLNGKRIANAKFYLDTISNFDIVLPSYEGGKDHVFHQFVIQSVNREQLINYLRTHEIETIVHYPVPPHQQAAFSSLEHQDLPMTEELHQRVLSLPIHSCLNRNELVLVSTAINDFKM